MTEYKSREGNRVYVKEGHKGLFIIIEEEKGKRGTFGYRFPPLNMCVFKSREAAEERLDCYAADHDLEVWTE